MKIPDIDRELIRRATEGDLAALDAILTAIQAGVFNLAVRMLGDREDARDACQEILLKVTTHLGSFRGESAFGTWVHRIAVNYLLTARTKIRESPEVSFEELDEKLRGGLEVARATWSERMLTPEEKTAAREVAVSCTQGMLMRLDRDHRAAYLLDTVFGLSSEEAARVLDINAPAYRKRLSRARRTLTDFSHSMCGMVNGAAPCRCEAQLHAIGRLGAAAPRPGLKLEPAERDAATAMLDRVIELGDIAAVIRSHPEYQVPAAMIEAIRGVLIFPGAADA